MPEKYRMYVDEVGHANLSKCTDVNSKYLTLTGAIFDIRYIDDVVAERLNNIKRAYFPVHHPDSVVVFHSSDMKGKRWPFDSLKDVTVQNNFDKDLLSLLSALDFTIISITIDKSTYSTRYPNWKFDHYHLCLENLLERYYMFLQDNRTVGDVLIESRKYKDDEAIKKLYRRIVTSGTSRIAKFDDRFTSKEIKIKPKIMNIPGLQIVDIVSNPIRRYVLAQKYEVPASPSVFSDNMFSTVLPKIRSSNKGVVWGYGLKNL